MVILEQKRERVMQIGDRVRVVTSVIVYHHPQHKKQPFDLQGLEGEIVDILHRDSRLYLLEIFLNI